MTRTPQAAADKIIKLVKEDERDLEWLSRKAHIPYSTLRAQLIYHPHRLTIQNIGHIAEALDRPIVDLVAS